MIIIENSGSSNSTTMRITMIFNILISRIRTIILTCIVSVLPNFIIVTDRILRSSSASSVPTKHRKHHHRHHHYTGRYVDLYRSTH